jgi:hypothetical protein
MKHSGLRGGGGEVDGHGHGQEGTRYGSRVGRKRRRCEAKKETSSQARQEIIRDMNKQGNNDQGQKSHCFTQ